MADDERLTDLSALAGGAGLNLVGLGSRAALVSLYSLLMARILGSTEYGLYVLGAAVVLILSQVSEMGLRHGTLRYAALYAGQGDLPRARGVARAALTVALTVAALAGGALFAAARPLAEGVFHKPELARVLRILAPATPMLAMVNIGVAYAQAFRVMRVKVMVQDLLMPGLELAAALTLAWLGWGARGSATAFLCAASVGAGGVAILAQRVQPWREAARIERRTLLGFALPAWLSDILLILTAYVNVLFLGRLMTSREVGVFNIALQTTFIGATFLNSVNLIFAPHVAVLARRGVEEQARLQMLYRESTRWVLTLALPLYLGLMLVARPFMALFGPQFAAGAFPMVIIAAAQIVNVGTGSVALLILMAGHSRISLLNAALGLAVNAGLSGLLIPRYGVAGAAAAYGAMIVVANLISVAEARALLKLHPFGRDYARPCLAGGAAMLAVWFGRPAGWIAALAIFAFVYVGAILAFGLTPADRRVAIATWVTVKERFRVRRCGHS